MSGKFTSLFVVITSAVMFQTGYTCLIESSSSPVTLLSLVGVTMCSTNDVPFEWASDYEVAVVYITSLWSELEDLGDSSSSVQGIIAKNGFLNYCARFKIELAAWAKSLRDNPDVSEEVKNTVSNWYQAVDGLSRDNWKLPDVVNLETFITLFRTSYKHLVINGREVYEKAYSEKTKRDVDDFTKRIANMLIGILRHISKQIRRVPQKYE